MLKRQRTDCSCSKEESSSEEEMLGRFAQINRFRQVPVVNTNYLIQTTPSHQFIFQTPLRNVLSAELELVWTEGLTCTQPMISLQCADLTAYQRGNASGTNSVTSPMVERNTIVWLQPTATITGPMSSTSKVVWQNRSNQLQFDVIKEISDINFRLDSFPIQGALTFTGQVTWRLTTKHVNAG